MGYGPHVGKSRTRLKQLRMHAYTHMYTYFMDARESFSFLEREIEMDMFKKLIAD